jgi:hypothetical protein
MGEGKGVGDEQRQLVVSPKMLTLSSPRSSALGLRLR